MQKIIILITILLINSSLALAIPPFADKEEVGCKYCHSIPPELNYRGNFYRYYGFSFAGFDDNVEAKKARVPVGPDPSIKPKSWTPETTAAQKIVGPLSGKNPLFFYNQGVDAKRPGRFIPVQARGSYQGRSGNIYSIRDEETKQWLIQKFGLRRE
jgi:hypothetical protein